MNLGIDKDCFFSNQISLENLDVYAAHAASCHTCKNKVKELKKEKLEMEAYFKNFTFQNTSQDVQVDLLKDLSKAESIIYPNFFGRLKNLAPVAKNNLNSFVFNLTRPVNLFLFATALSFYLITKNY